MSVRTECNRIDVRILQIELRIRSDVLLCAHVQHLNMSVKAACRNELAIRRTVRYRIDARIELESFSERLTRRGAPALRAIVRSHPDLVLSARQDKFAVRAERNGPHELVVGMKHWIPSRT